MNLIVVNPEKAKKLKDAGWRHNTIFAWQSQVFGGEEVSLYLTDQLPPMKIPNEQTYAPTASEIAEQLVEKKYQLRVEHNHGDMKWYAYYGGKFGDNKVEIDGTGASTMADALAELWINSQEKNNG